MELESDFEYGWANDKLVSYITLAANLKGKEKLVSLSIELRNKQSKEKSKIVLEGLQPHPNLRRLWIKQYNGERIPSWMMSWGQLPYNSLPNLVEIKLFEFPSSKYLCSFRRLLHLKVLKLTFMEQLEYVENTNTTTSSHPNPSNPLATALAPNPLFPSLEQLELECMPKLKGWRKIMCTSSTSSSNSEEESQVLQNCCYYSAFPRLKKLTFDKVGLEVVPEEFRYLSALESLCLDYCDQLEEVPAWIDTLTSLKRAFYFEVPQIEVATEADGEPLQLGTASNYSLPHP